MDWPFDNTFARELPWLGARVDPVPVAAPRLLALNDELAEELGLDPQALRAPEGVAVLAGNAVAPGSEPIAQAYGGHQFGHWSGLLGDGRAHLLGEIVDTHGIRRDLSLKGSGRTPFSRGGDGRAVVGPVLREYLMGEAMHALGIPTSRALAAVATGEIVRREQPQPGAVLTRVAASHLRVGTVQLVRQQGTLDQLAALVEYTRARHHAQVAPGDALGLLDAVVTAQAELLAAWTSVGFLHGVMNTDNTTLSGETIDYGPCAFLDAWDENAVFSSIDHAGRYRFGQQPAIAAWNLARLAEALLPLFEGTPEDAVADATARIDAFFPRFDAARLRRFGARLALADPSGPAATPQGEDAALITELLDLLQRERLDLTGTLRSLGTVLRGEPGAIADRLDEPAAWIDWQSRWLARVGPPGSDREATAEALDAVNPVYIPRNHLVEAALTAAHAGDLGPFETLLDAVRHPFTAVPGREPLAAPAPASFTTSHVTYCGT